eukprot:gene2711-3523_t
MTQAKIESIETILVDLPTVRPHKLAMHTISQQTLVIIRLRCSDGIEGLGESTTVGGLSYANESPESIKTNIDVHLAPALIGMDASNFNAAMQRLDRIAKGNTFAKAVLQSWADAEWFTSRPEVPQSIKLTVLKVTGETNTDDLSPAPDAWSRPDIPLHALAMLKNKRDGITPEEDGKRGPVKFIEDLRARGNLVAYVGDVVGTGSSRKSATNSVLWFTGEDIPFVPNKRFGGVCLGSKIAPIFYNTMEDAGALPIELDVSQMHMGDEIEL